MSQQTPPLIFDSPHGVRVPGMPSEKKWIVIPGHLFKPMVDDLKSLARILNKYPTLWDNAVFQKKVGDTINIFKKKYRPFLERVLQKHKAGYFYDLGIFKTEPQLRLATSFIYWHRMVFSDQGPLFWEISNPGRKNEGLGNTKVRIKSLWMHNVSFARTIRGSFSWIRRTSSVEEGKMTKAALKLKTAKKMAKKIALPYQEIFNISKMKPGEYADMKLLSNPIVQRILKANHGTSSKATLRKFIHNI